MLDDIDDIKIMPYGSSEKDVRYEYTCSSIKNFAAFLGLVELKEVEESRYSRNYEVKKLPLLDEVVQFFV